MSGIVFCLAYILGLLSTTVEWGGYAIVAVGITISIVLTYTASRSDRYTFRQVKPTVMLAASALGFLATLYFQARLPYPAANDISQVNNNTQQQVVTVQGKIDSVPRLTRSQKGQFWLEVSEFNRKKVTGKLYVTVPLLQTTGLYPGQRVTVSGVLYRPKPASNPGSFDFQKFLQRENTFAGMSGRQVKLINSEPPPWGLWQINRQIVRSQVRWLGSPEGQLVSSMVLGSKAVDLPYDIRDLFIRVGLAHALAASGFQTALILGLVLTLTKRFGTTWQFGCGVGALFVFIGLTGLQPSVLRAVIMGFGALIALATERKVKPLGSLLIAATLLLLFNPLWIWDLGFELSFLATLGLIVTVPALINRLDWMPNAIATLIAVPIAAALWTLPLQLYVFGVVPVYSLIANIFSIPLISIISIGGIISAIAALVSPIVGSALAWLLYYPTRSLILLVELFSRLPGNSYAVGKIAIWQLLAVYGAIALVCFLPWWRKRWWFAGAIAVGLVLIPVWQIQATVFRVTILAAGTEPVMVIQEGRKVLVFSSGEQNTSQFTTLPFLQQQGINQIDWAIATNLNTNNNWQELLQRFPVKNFYAAQENAKLWEKVRSLKSSSLQMLQGGESVTAGSTTFKLVDAQIPIWQIQIQNKNWLLVGSMNLKEQNLTNAQVLWSFGKSLDRDTVEAIAPEVVIISSSSTDTDSLANLRTDKVQVFSTVRDGAIQWTAANKFEPTLESPETNSALL
nr:ComEC/Rec2 family competence protein [Aliterella atlantica]